MAKGKRKKSKGDKPKKRKKSEGSKPKKTKRKRGKKTKPVFEGRRKRKAPEPEPSGPPPGFDVNLGDITQDEAYATMKARLDDARDRLPEGYAGRVTMHAYADGSVDGELYIRLDGEDTRDAEFDLYDAFTNLSVGRRYWISVGGRYIVETDDERYKRNKGMTQVQTNYQRATPTNIAETHLIMRHSIIKGMKAKFGEEARDLFIRLHWNPAHEQPKR